MMLLLIIFLLFSVSLHAEEYTYENNEGSLKVFESNRLIQTIDVSPVHVEAFKRNKFIYLISHHDLDLNDKVNFLYVLDGDTYQVLIKMNDHAYKVWECDGTKNLVSLSNRFHFTQPNAPLFPDMYAYDDAVSQSCKIRLFKEYEKMTVVFIDEIEFVCSIQGPQCEAFGDINKGRQQLALLRKMLLSNQ